MKTKRLRVLVSQCGWLGVLVVGAYVALVVLVRRALTVRGLSHMLLIGCAFATIYFGHQPQKRAKRLKNRAGSVQYAIIDLGTFGLSVQAKHLNAHGDAVGLVFVGDNHMHA